MTAQYLNLIGLTLNIFGVVMVFFFGFPQPSHEDSVGNALETLVSHMLMIRWFVSSYDLSNNPWVLIHADTLP